MRYPSELTEATLLRRYKRFLTDVELPDGRVVVAHCPNSGRMTGCWAPGVPCRVSYAPSPRRKLDWTLEQTCMQGVWCMVHTGRTNAIVAEGIMAGVVAELAGWPTLEREVRHGDSRFDLRLRDGERACWVEVKNVTLPVEGGGGAFPDAVSARGTKHVRHLAAMAREGLDTVLLFHVGRADIAWVRPAVEVDPTFASALVDAEQAGVRLLACRSSVDVEEVVLRTPVAVRATSAAPAPR